MPVEWQRRAILKIAELAAAQGKFSEAEQSLQNFLAQFQIHTLRMLHC